MVKRFHHYKLDNGIDVIFYPIEEVRAVAINVGLLAGSAIEKEGEVGTFHFLEHVLFQGSKNYQTPKDVAVRSEELGMSSNAGVGSLETRFWATFPDAKIKESLEFFHDTLVYPLITEESVENSKRVILTEQRNFWDRPENRFYHSALTQRIGEQHPYNRRGFGESKVVEGMTVTRVKQHYYDYYIPENLMISIAGNADHDDLKKMLNNTLGNWDRKGKLLTDLKTPPVEYKKTYYTFDEPRRQVNFRLSFPARGFNEYTLRQRLELGLFSFMLGSGMTAVLYQKLREELGLVYDIWSTVTYWPYVGMFEVGGEVDAENLSAAMVEVFNTLDRVKADGFDKKSFERAKNYMNMQTLLRFSGVERISSYFIGLMLDRHKIMLPEEFVKEAEPITLQDINRTAANVLGYGRVGLAMMGDDVLIRESGVKEVFDKLAA